MGRGGEGWGGGGEVGTCERLVGIASFGLTAYPHTACDVVALVSEIVQASLPALP